MNRFFFLDFRTFSFSCREVKSVPWMRCFFCRARSRKPGCARHPTLLPHVPGRSLPLGGTDGRLLGASASRTSLELALTGPRAIIRLLREIELRAVSGRIRNCNVCWIDVVISCLTPFFDSKQMWIEPDGSVSPAKLQRSLPYRPGAVRRSGIALGWYLTLSGLNGSRNNCCIVQITGIVIRQLTLALARLTSCGAEMGKEKENMVIWGHIFVLLQ